MANRVTYPLIAKQKLAPKYTLGTALVTFVLALVMAAGIISAAAWLFMVLAGALNLAWHPSFEQSYIYVFLIALVGGVFNWNRGKK